MRGSVGVVVIGHLRFRLTQIDCAFQPQFLHPLCLYEQRAAFLQFQACDTQKFRIVLQIDVGVEHADGNLVLPALQRRFRQPFLRLCLLELADNLPSGEYVPRERKAVAVAQRAQVVVGVGGRVDGASEAALQRKRGSYRREERAYGFPVVEAVVVVGQLCAFHVEVMLHGVEHAVVGCPFPGSRSRCAGNQCRHYIAIYFHHSICFAI